MKSGVLAAFFCLFLSGTVLAGEVSADLRAPDIGVIKQQAAARKLSASPVWAALLHVVDQHPAIADDGFILSRPAFSTDAELQKTIEYLYGGSATNVCRFPARYLWLRQQMDVPALPLDACPQVIEFKRHVPLDHVSLVFASENLAQPASMMGHTFIKIGGKSHSGEERDFAVSFVTDTSTLNVPKLFFDSIVRGKPGYFSLSLYSEKLQRYVDEEQRSVWEYPLQLDSDQRELIAMHLLELKQTNLQYFFQKYNCATVINFILSLSGRPMPDNGWWLTPKDVVKNASRAGLSTGSRVIAPSRWLVRGLAPQISSAEQDQIREQVLQGHVIPLSPSDSSNDAFIRTEFLRAYNQYAYTRDKIDHATWLRNGEALSGQTAAPFAGKALELSQQYNPVDSPGERQVSAAVRHEDGDNMLLLTVLPVSHGVDDDNRTHASETGLQLFETTLKLAPHAGPRLEKLTFYGVKSLMPYDRLTGGVSGGFRFGVEQQRDRSLDEQRSVSMSGELGLTTRIHDDADLYGLAGAGAAAAKGRGYVYSTFRLGAIVREIWNMKTRLELARMDNQIDPGSHYYALSINQARYLDPSLTLNFDWMRLFNHQYQRHALTFSVKKVF